jgi:hypothetical protein
MTEKKTPTQAEAAPAASVSSDPEINMIPESQVEALIEKRLSEMLARVNVNQPSSDAEALGKSIAINTAKLAGKKSVDPDIVVAREKKWAEMEAEISAAITNGERAEYKLVRDKTVFLPAGKGYTMIESHFQGSDRMWHETVFAWPGIPNEAMIPVNETAKRIHALFLKAIAYNPNEQPRHAIMPFDVSIIKGVSQVDVPEVALPTVTPVGGGVEILTGSTKRSDRVAVIGGVPAVEANY